MRMFDFGSHWQVFSQQRLDAHRLTLAVRSLQSLLQRKTLHGSSFFWHDVIDWIGGYPYEYSPLQHMQAFVTAQGFALRRYVPAQVPTGCNEFIFEKLLHESKFSQEPCVLTCVLS